MKVLHVITSLRTGGAEKLMVDLLPRLKERGHEIDLLLFDGSDTPFRRDAEAAGLRVIDFGAGSSVYNPLHITRLRNLLKGYDAVHTHNTSPQLFTAIASLGKKIKLITTEHNTHNRRRQWAGYDIIDKWMYNRYDKIICISQKAEDNLREYLGNCRGDILTINNGVDIQRYAEAQSGPELEILGPDSKKIIMVAGFRQEKDQDTLIRAVNYLPKDFHLFLVGDGVRRPELEALIQSEGIGHRVHLMGVRTDVPSLLHSADYIVMSSHHEGLSLSSVEGMSAGRPFLASDVDGLREVVQGAGVLFPHGQFRSLAKAIIDLATNPERYKAVAAACYERAKDYDISTMADKYSEVYKNLMK